VNANQKKFVGWLVKNHPKVARAATRAVERDALMGDLGSFIDAFTSAIEKVAPALISADQQRRIMKMQVDRARQGLAPLEASQYSPTVRVEPSFTVPGWVKWGAGGVAALFIGKKLIKG